MIHNVRAALTSTQQFNATVPLSAWPAITHYGGWTRLTKRLIGLKMKDVYQKSFDVVIMR